MAKLCAMPVRALRLHAAHQAPGSPPKPFLLGTFQLHSRYPSSSQARCLATVSSASSRRKAVTVLSDDGATPWTDLSTGEKAARTAQQTFNFGLVIVGACMTGGIVWLLWTNVASPSSKTHLFSRCVTELRASSKVREALGPAKQIRAFGDGRGGNRWTRNAAIPATFQVDARGVEHAKLTFNVEGPQGKGVVRAELVRRGRDEFEFAKLKVEVVGKEVVWVYGQEQTREANKGFKFLGLDWGKR